MRIEVSKFGDVLISRPGGREAYLAFRHRLEGLSPAEAIELDFDGVLVLAPSWLDELVQGIRGERGNPIVFLPSGNTSVIETLKWVR